MPESNPSPVLYPAGLLRWAGHRGGGVRKPFNLESGRPTGGRITTPLVRRLQTWVADLVANVPSTPRTILLVGGPGNGKTDAVETCIEFLDLALHAEGHLFQAFAAKFDIPSGNLPPRKVAVDLSGIGLTTPPHLDQTITLVQDATEGDATLGRAAEQLLLEDLTDRLAPDRSGVYLCCVNRGKLAEAAALAQETPHADGAIALLSKITESVTSGPTSPRCWPLDGFPHIAIWPMDVESLVDPSIAEGGQTVAHQILAAALDETRWGPGCEAGPRCPFCQNRELLLRTGAVDALVRLLRYYELASGKRWTFRDLFSLVPYLLVGDYSELEVNSRPVAPCDWAKHQLQLSKTTQTSDPGRPRALYLLVSRLYHHRLFPRWPGLDRGANRKAKSILQDASFSPGLDRARDFFRYLAHAANQAEDSSGEILSRIRGSLGDLLDPALAPGGAVLFSRGGESFSTNQVEERFSLSVREGLDLVSGQLDPLERDLLRQLAEADDALVEENFPRTKAHYAKVLQASLRQFCARLVKRSIGGRRGLCRDANYFLTYEKALHDPRELLDVRRQLKKLLHDDRNQFRASLVTTFGQPVAQRARDIVLLTPSVTIRDFTATVADGRPPEPIPYLKVDRHVVPLTFSLFKALREVVAGLHDASLPAEIFALLNGIKSLVSGNLVRDPQRLDEESRIELGNSGQAIEINGETFHVMEVMRQ